MQVMVTEFARNVCGMSGANTTEIDPESPFPVISLLEEQTGVVQKGGTMRLGADPVKLHEGTRAMDIYGEPVIYKRHRHRYEVNNLLRTKLEDEGLVCSGTSPDERLVEALVAAEVLEGHEDVGREHAAPVDEQSAWDGRVDVGAQASPPRPRCWGRRTLPRPAADHSPGR